MTNGECINTMTSKELTNFLFEVEFVRKCAYPVGKAHGDWNTLNTWINSEMTINLKDRNELMEYSYKEHHKEMGFTEKAVKDMYKVLLDK